MFDSPLLIYLPLVFGTLILGLTAGSWDERRHYESIRKREAATLHIPVITSQDLPDDRPVEATLAIGSVVVSVDAFKRFIGGLRMIFGGEIPSYSSLIDRARREALLRMKESRPEADLFLNYRVETASIGGQGEERLMSVEVVAYATAITFTDPVTDEVRS